MYNSIKIHFLNYSILSRKPLTSNLFNFFLNQVLRSGIRPSYRKFTTQAATGTQSFGLTEDQLEIKNLARKFSREEIIPVAAKLDKTGEYPWDLIKKAHAVGLLNSGIPEEYGGSNQSVFNICTIAEEISYGCSGVMTAMEASGLGVS